MFPITERKARHPLHASHVSHEWDNVYLGRQRKEGPIITILKPLLVVPIQVLSPKWQKLAAYGSGQQWMNASLWPSVYLDITHVINAPRPSPKLDGGIAWEWVYLIQWTYMYTYCIPFYTAGYVPFSGGRTWNSSWLGDQRISTLLLYHVESLIPEGEESAVVTT